MKWRPRAKSQRLSSQGKVFWSFSVLIIGTDKGYSDCRLIFAKHDGDDMNQPEWAEDGSFLVIRELQQLVPEFEK